MMIAVAICFIIAIGSLGLYIFLEYKQDKRVRENEARLAELALIVEKHDKILEMVKEIKPVPQSPARVVASRELRGR